MKINSIAFRTPTWAIEDLHLDDFNLLVGVSGAGKTQILRALMGIRNLVINGVNQQKTLSSTISQIICSINFTIDNNNYKWELVEDIDSKNSQTKTVFYIYAEFLYKNNIKILSRYEGDITFLGAKMPKLPSDVTLISIFKEESEIKPIYDAFLNIGIWDNSQGSFGRKYLAPNIKIDASSFNFIENQDTEILLRLYIALKLKDKRFDTISNEFINIFPTIERVSIRVNPSGVTSLILIPIEKNAPPFFGNDISSGMLRTLYFLAYLHLSPKGTIMLIDEFENGFGINCIGALAHEMLMQQDKIQFVVTSHHPYIINIIPHQNWKIVTRKQKDNINYISVHKSDELDVESSHHEKYMQLINSPLFTEGIG